MKKKVAIITIYGLKNYGNRLQNYALHKILTNYGFNVRTITLRNLDCYIDNKAYRRWRFQELTHYVFKKNRFSWKVSRGRLLAFRKFTLDYIPTIHCDDLNKLNNMADYFVAGSDQLWNPLWFDDIEKKFFLLHYVDDNKKVTYAPSFGVDYIPDEYIDLFTDCLKKFDKISVREKSGVDLINQLTGKDAVQLIDPTLLLSEHYWYKLKRKPRNISFKKKYILIYFLGNETEQIKDDLHYLTDKYNFETYKLLNIEQPDIYACGPREFLYMISKASLVLTDSFHACVFSFLFNIPFIVYQRSDSKEPDMLSRIYTLLNQFNLQDRFRHSVNFENPLDIDFGNGKRILKEQRIIANNFLKKELNIEEC